MRTFSRKLALSLGLLVPMGLLLLSPGVARANGVITVPFHTTLHNQTAVFPFVDPCTGATGTVTATFTLIDNGLLLIDPDDGTITINGVFNTIGDFTSLTEDGSSITGHYSSVSAFGGSFNADGGTIENVLNAVGYTQDGDRVNTHLVTHIVVFDDHVDFSFTNGFTTCG
jgi:hypothetical protein